MLVVEIIVKIRRYHFVKGLADTIQINGASSVLVRLKRLRFIRLKRTFEIYFAKKVDMRFP